jgi:hypothetical protein
MTATYEKISTQTVSGSSTSTIDFSSIPSTYTDLVLISSAALSASGFALSVRVGTANSPDTGSNYSRTYLLGFASSTASGQDSNSTFVDLNGSSYTSGAPAVAITNFMNYSNTTTNKTILSRSGGAADSIQAEVFMYRNTSALNFIRVYVQSGYIYAGSTFTLYGIKAE